MVMWLIGLSGAGKSTLANEIVAQARKKASNVVLIDGDVVRQVWGNDLGHTLADRRKNAERICRLGKFLEDQGCLVVVAILSLFPDTREWNRLNLKSYYEVYVDTPMEKLVERDSKGLYKRALKGELKDVAGVDLKFEPPAKPDLTIRNDADEAALLAHAPVLAKILTEKR